MPALGSNTGHFKLCDHHRLYKLHCLLWMQVFLCSCLLHTEQQVWRMDSCAVFLKCCEHQPVVLLGFNVPLASVLLFNSRLLLWVQVHSQGLESSLLGSKGLLMILWVIHTCTVFIRFAPQTGSEELMYNIAWTVISPEEVFRPSNLPYPKVPLQTEQPRGFFLQFWKRLHMKCAWQQT